MGIKIYRLEDLEAWVQARKLAKMLFDLGNSLPKDEKYSLAHHLKENGRHVPSNIAEGFGRFYLKDSVQFYRVAMGSLEESKSDTYQCLDRNYINKGQLEVYLSQINLVEKLVYGLIGSASKVKPAR